MADAAEQQQGASDQVVPVPDDAQFFLVADAAHATNALIAPLSIHAAQPGDVVVHAGSKAGTYLGSGRMRRQSDTPL